MTRHAAVPDSKPLVTLYLSERCNSRCISCDYWRHGSRDMSLDDVQRLLPELDALGTRHVLISGGEPLLNREWPEIARLLSDAGIRIWLLTSGLALAKHSAAVARLFESVTVSLDGTCAQTYAAIRGVDAFDKVCEGVRTVAETGVPTGIRVTLQKANYREIGRFVDLARALGASQVSFLAADISNGHAFAREPGINPKLGLETADLEKFDACLDALETEHSDAFRTGYIAESPAKLRRIRTYFAALLGQCPFPPVRCNAPEFSTVVGADGAVSPCFFIPGPRAVPRAPDLRAAIASDDMRSLRASIRDGNRPECERCVCSMWRDPATITEADFRLPEIAGG